MDVLQIECKSSNLASFKNELVSPTLKAVNDLFENHGNFETDNKGSPEREI